MRFKKISIFLGLFIIYSLFLVSVFTEDVFMSDIENKILAKRPELTMRTIKNGTFMKKFDRYVTDQFPGRTSWITLKNDTEFTLGKREFNNIYITNSGRMLEKFKINKENIESNIEGINNIASKHNLSATLMLIPTSIEIYKDELPKHAITDSQKELLEKEIKELSKVKYISTLNILDKNKDEYIFFKTDHHWTQLAAKLVFEELSGISIEEKATLASNDFYGTYYSKALNSNTDSDDIFYYKSTGNYPIEIDFYRKQEKLYDDDKLKTKNKYQFFLSGDPGHAIIHGNGEEKILIFKDSFAHNFIPFLAEYYKEIHVIDSRYFNVDLDSYLKEHDLKNILFIHNINTLNTEKIY